MAADFEGALSPVDAYRASAQQEVDAGLSVPLGRMDEQFFA